MWVHGEGTEGGTGPLLSGPTSMVLSPTLGFSISKGLAPAKVMAVRINKTKIILLLLPKFSLQAFIVVWTILSSRVCALLGPTSQIYI